MAKTPHIKFRLATYIQNEIKRRTKNVSAWIRQAIQEKLERDKNN